jgi:hypothetical protein
MSGRPLAALAATALLATVLPLTVSSPAQAEDAFGGFNARADATPIRVEMFEPSIPIPSDPQAEFRLSYTTAVADSTTSGGRSSYLWPGDAVGGGLKTFFEQIGLPGELVADGYPVQVNSSFPSGEGSQKDEPFPGMVMRTTSKDGSASASAGFSSDGSLEEKESGEDGAGLPGGGDLGPLSELLDPLLGGLSGSSTKPTAKSTSRSTSRSGTAQAEPGAPSVPGLPPELAALVDVDGFYSTSKASSVDGMVVSTARSSLGAIKLLEGIITISGVETRSTSTTDGAKGTTRVKSRYGTLSLAGQEFSIGPDGIEATGTTTPIPGLNDDPAKALEQLGVRIEVPEPIRESDGDMAGSMVQGLKIELDTATLRPVLSAMPSGQLAELIPAEAGPLKGLVGALSNMAPRIVLTLGVSSTQVDTVPPMEFPELPGTDTDSMAPLDMGGDAGAGGPDGAGIGGTGDAGMPGPGGDVPASAPGAAGDLPPNTSVSASPGLPPLGSIPGMLLFGGIALAAVAGSWFRKLGVLALGAGVPCPHGLDTGLPDLRKM